MFKTPQGRWDSGTPGFQSTPSYGSTPFGATPLENASSGKRRRWDETPEMISNLSQNYNSRFTIPTQKQTGISTTPQTPGISYSLLNTPSYSLDGSIPGTPLTPGIPTTPDQIQSLRIQYDIYERNRQMTDLELNQILPTNGYRICDPPKNYEPMRTPARLWGPSPTPGVDTGFQMAKTPGINSQNNVDYGISLNADQMELPFIKPEEMQIFGPLLKMKVLKVNLSA